MFGIKSKATQEVFTEPATEPATERCYREAWGFTRQGWEALTWQDRADYRDRVAYATAGREAN